VSFAKDTESKQAPMLASSLRVMMITLSWVKMDSAKIF